MSFFEDIFDTSTAIGKGTFAITILVVLWLMVTGGSAGVLLYNITHPEVRGAGLRPEDLLSKPEVVRFAIPGARDREGWFFPGLTTSPTIILCHGYQGHRSDLITLVSALQKDRFNVFIFDFSAHGSTTGSTSLGPKETKELLAAVDAILQRTDVDRARVGVLGFDLGGYAALAAALSDKRIKAVAVDSAFDQPRVMFNLLAADSLLSRIPLVTTVAWWGYTVTNWGSRQEPALLQRLPALRDTAKFFIQGRDNPVLAEATLQLFLRAPEPRKQSVTPKSKYSEMQEDEKKDYEAEVVHFFLEAFPPVIGR